MEKIVDALLLLTLFVPAIWLALMFSAGLLASLVGAPFGAVAVASLVAAITLGLLAVGELLGE